jgi:hypothetical protein
MCCSPQFLQQLPEDALSMLVGLNAKELEAFQGNADSFKVVKEWHNRSASNSADGRVPMRNLVRQVRHRLDIQEAEARFLITNHPMLRVDVDGADEVVSAKEDT